MSTGLITHYDLDGCVSALFAMKAFDISEYKCGGYPKIDKNLNHLISAGHENLVVTDLNFTEEQLGTALANFEKVYYFDHHIESKKLKIYEKFDKFDYHYNGNISATALVYSHWIKECGGKTSSNLAHMAHLTDVYDLWRTDHKLFNEAYRLNDLFWRYNFFGFIKKYKDGFPGFTVGENLWLDKKKERRERVVEDSPCDKIGDNAHVILLKDFDAVNSVQFLLPGEVFIILCRRDNQYGASIRIKSEREHFDVNESLKELVKMYPDKLDNGGGHKLAGGCSFNKSMNINDVLKFVKEHMNPILNPL